ncbi:MAG TPA: GSU2403 family nucleotidyltransferase fold protein [Burkholderiales bacterium]|nr:GSU2403 family nucleotidyltransferase fold protein [Burkholderiales bacterium]
MSAVRPLFRRHDPAGQTRYQDLRQLARSQGRVLAGSPGVLKQRTQSGNRYWVREYMRIDGRKVDDYLGAETSLAKARIAELREEIDLAKALASGSAKLRLFGYQRIERKPAAVLEVLFNRGLTQAGLTLVGSHAYGALLNELGVIAPAYRTQDLDLARAQPLAIALPEGITLRQLLDETGLTFVPVPGMPSHRPSASFKLPGAETLVVDLLVPGNSVGRVVPVKELGTHAQTIPLLDFLIEEPIESVVLSPNQIIPVKLPAPERFLLHKLYSSQSRKTDRDKVRKDLDQAALLAAALEEDTPGALGRTFRRMPAIGKTPVARGARAAARIVEGVHPEAEAALLEIAGKR